MGRWGWHPMASDSAMDFRDDFERFVFDCDDYYEFENYEEQLKEKLEVMTVEKLEEYFKKSEIAAEYTQFGDCLYVLPYEFARYKVKVKDDVKEYLRDLLIKSIKSIADEKDDYILTNLLPFIITEKSNLFFLYSQQEFLAHFDEVFDLKYHVDEDECLVKSLSKPAMKDKYDDLFQNMRMIEGWHGTLFELVTKQKNNDKAISFIKELAKNGDLAAKDIVCYNLNLFKEDVDFLIECLHDVLLACHSYPNNYFGDEIEAYIATSFLKEDMDDEYKLDIFQEYTGKSIDTNMNLIEIYALTEKYAKEWYDKWQEDNPDSDDYSDYEYLVDEAVEWADKPFTCIYLEYYLEEIVDRFRGLIVRYNGFSGFEFNDPIICDDNSIDMLNRNLYFCLLYICCYMNLDVNKCDDEIKWLNKKGDELLSVFSNPNHLFFELGNIKMKEYPTKNFLYTIKKLEGYLNKTKNKENVGKAIELLKTLVGKIKG